MPILVVLGFEKSVVQRYRPDILRVNIVNELRINIEENWHIDSLASIQPLFLKAEALDLAEVSSDLSWRDRICRHSDNVFRRFVRCSVERKSRLARQHPNLSLLWDKFPREYV